MGPLGASVDELCEAVGYTQRTIVKHLEGLAGYGMAAQGAGGKWAATSKSQRDVAREGGLPDARAGDREPAGMPVL
ncbi:hypothetical protein ACLF6K_07195 [Streptomyces xanthophaeus]|uniref:hypothetical protein n=1 Tax=Streptomyces xanthophaeus TaxID=67385 RepID=UPI00398FFBB4